MLPGFLDRHPLAPDSHGQGFLACLYELQEMLKESPACAAVSLTPMAGAQGEFAGVAMIRAYHRARGDIGPDRDPGAGCRPRHQSRHGDDVRLQGPGDSHRRRRRRGSRLRCATRSARRPPASCSPIRPRSACSNGASSTSPRIVHAAGGLLYYDGANLNAILGKVRPGDMGFDVIHMNLHKTFSTPHGGGGPGAGPVGVTERLEPFLPVPRGRPDGDEYHWLAERERPQSIGRLSAFMGNAGMLLRAYVYVRMLGREGMGRVAELRHAERQLPDGAADGGRFRSWPIPERRASHEFIVTLKREAKELGVTAMDFAKRLLDYGFHAPTTYFPLLVPECLLIEPTETETKEELDAFVEAMIEIRREAHAKTRTLVKGAPHTLPVRRLDDVRAARQLDLAWTPLEADANDNAHG